MSKELELLYREEFKGNYDYKDFLSRLGIDPKDFEDEFEIEMDDYSK